MTGLTIYNTANTLQIDSSYQNLVLISKKYYPKTADIEQEGLLFAFSGQGYINSGLFGDKTLKVYGSGTVYGFGLAPQLTNQNIGLQVFDENGNTCFSSYSKPMRVLDMINGNFFNLAKPNIVKNYDVAQCAVCVGQPYVAWTENNDYKIGLFNCDTTNGVHMTPLSRITTNKFTYENTSLSRYIGEYNYLILDVSHY